MEVIAYHRESWKGKEMVLVDVVNSITKVKYRRLEIWLCEAKTMI